MIRSLWVAVSLASVIVGCKPAVETTEKDSASVTAAPQASWPTQMRENFIANCQKRGSSSDFCACGQKRMESRFSAQEMMALELQANSGKVDTALSAAMVDVQSSCVVVTADDESQEEALEQEVATNEWPIEMETNFVNACSARGSSAEQCQCITDQIKSEFSAERFAALEMTAQMKQEFPEELLQAMARAKVRCAGR